MRKNFWMTAVSSFGKGTIDRGWHGSSRLAKGHLVGFVLLPTLVVLGIGIVVGPPLWRMWYPPVREFCVAHFALLAASHLAWKIILLLLFVSLVALVLNLTRDLVLSGRLKRTIARHGVTTPENLKQLQRRHRLRRPVVCTEEEGLYAFCYGLRRPAIVISSGLNKALSAAELEAVFLHEAAHAKSRDPLKILLSSLLARALFYIPPLRTLQERYVLRLEVMADRGVVDALGAQPLAGALSKMLRAPASSRTSAIAPGMASATEERILYLLEPQRKLPSLTFSRAEVIASSLLVVGSGLLGGGFVSVANGLIGAGAVCQFQM